MINSDAFKWRQFSGYLINPTADTVEHIDQDPNYPNPRLRLAPSPQAGCCTHTSSRNAKKSYPSCFICCYHCLGNTYLVVSMRSSCWEETHLTMPRSLIFMKIDRPCLQGVMGAYELSAKKLKPFRLSIKLHFLIQPFMRLPCLWASQWDEKLLM